MSTTMKTPGVYVHELDAFGNAVVPVATAVPVFIGYTKKVTFNGKTLVNKPVRINSLAEYMGIYDDPAVTMTFKVTNNKAGDAPAPSPPNSVTLGGVKYFTGNAPPTAALGKATDLFIDTKAGVAYKKGAGVDGAAGEWTKDDSVIVLTSEKSPDDLETPEKGSLYINNEVKEIFGPFKEDTKWPKGVKIPAPIVPVPPVVGQDDYTIGEPAFMFRMHGAIQLFYANGGADCFIISLGDYTEVPTAKAIGGVFDLLQKEVEPTLLVIPDAVSLKDKAYGLQGQMINHCGTMMNRVAILDIPGAGISEESPTEAKTYELFRDNVTGTDTKFNSYAAAYYPWLHTSIYSISDISYKNIASDDYVTVRAIMTTEFTPESGTIDPAIKAIIEAYKTPAVGDTMTIGQADAILRNLSVQYKNILGMILDKLNLMPPSAAMAGVYTITDNATGVWKAPANVALQDVVAPSIKIDHDMQGELNVPVNGKSICAIRAFTGKGNLVWGARTMDGNSNDWRYINVRRTLIFLEQSIKDAANAYVFAANDAKTWVNVESMISSFLTGVWNQGGLVGPKPSDAFQVLVGLGTTMTNSDIQLGIMRVMVKVAVSHPAEFIEITFQQEMQKA